MSNEPTAQPGAVAQPPSSPPPQAGTGETQPQTTPQPSGNPAPTSGEPDPSKWDEGTKAYISELRKESAKYRTEAKTVREKMESVGKALGVQVDETAEQKAARIHAQLEQVAFENAVLSNAIEHGINKDDMEFFEFQLAKSRTKLEEGEELPAEAIAEIAKSTKARSVKAPATTTVTHSSPGGGATSAPPPAGNHETLTVEAFAALGYNARVDLATKNPELYERLMAQASQKRLIR